LISGPEQLEIGVSAESGEAPKERWQSRKPIRNTESPHSPSGMETLDFDGQKLSLPFNPGGSRFRLPERNPTRLFFFDTAKLNKCG
jgi:hypothetical protein